MFSENRLSTINLPAAIVGSRNKSIPSVIAYSSCPITILPTDLIDYDDGGIGLNDPSAGLLYQEWICETDGQNITVRAANTAKTTIYTGIDISLVSCTFDQNMAPVVAFVAEGVSKFRWYDSTIEDYTVETINGAFPRVFLDDKRAEFTASSDVLLVYSRVDSSDPLVPLSQLFMRRQRDRYETESLLISDYSTLFAPTIPIVNKFVTFGMGVNMRLQFVFTYIPDVITDGCGTFEPLDPYDIGDLFT
jgi:hypothetical protein